MTLVSLQARSQPYAMYKAHAQINQIVPSSAPRMNFHPLRWLDVSTVIVEPYCYTFESNPFISM